MKTYAQPEAVTGSLEALTGAVSKLKKRVQQQYEQVYPALGDIFRYVIDKEEANAWNLSPFCPHLVLPDLVEAHIAQLGLQPIIIEVENVVSAPALAEPREHPAHALEEIYASLIPAAVPIH